MARKQPETILGHPVRFTRRRYGRTTYTWVEVKLHGEWMDLGDPWPCVMPTKDSLQMAVQYLIDLNTTANQRDLHPSFT